MRFPNKDEWRTIGIIGIFVGVILLLIGVDLGFLWIKARIVGDGLGTR